MGGKTGELINYTKANGYVCITECLWRETSQSMRTVGELEIQAQPGGLVNTHMVKVWHECHRLVEQPVELVQARIPFVI